MTGTPRRRHRRASGIQLGTGNTLTTNYRPSRGPLPEALACSVWSPLSRRQALPCPPGVLAVREGQSGHEHRWTGPQIQPTKHVEATHGVTRRTGTRHRCERQQGDYAQLARREDALASAFHVGVVAVAWAAVGWGERRPGRSRVAAGAAVPAGGRLGGWRAAWRDPCRSGQTVGVAGRGQQRSGRARSRANAQASSTAHGQEACRRRIRRRAGRTIRAATCRSR
jgi:hypothetical protein